ncbi:MAG TPA: hypothetical protein VFA79_13015 [Myxococcales bacterium]|nr:hypothetical protein [Myxococcales bacterium]
MTALTAEQARALIGLRAKVWWRRIVQGRQWVRFAIGILAAGLGMLFSASLCILVIQAADMLGRHPARLWSRGGPAAIFAAWLTMALAGRLWFGLIALAQSQAFLDPRRFRFFPVSPRLLSAINLGALFADPIWLVLYPPLIAIALSVSRLPGAPAAWMLLLGEALSVWAVVGVLHLGAALAALFDARPILRRTFSVVLLLAGFAGFQLSMSVPGSPGMTALFESRAWRSWSPPGWAARFATALSGEQLLPALGFGLLLLLVGFACSAAGHVLSFRELVRPAESARASASAARGADAWRFPLSDLAISALFEKEAKTIVRVGWLQLVVVPVAYLLLVRTVLPGPEPLLIAAVYAHLGVLEVATNAFGRDLDAARAWFLWPVTLRSVLLAKNAVAYLFSLAIFLLLALVAAIGSHLTPGQFLVGILAHAAIFPLLATFGNAISVLYPVPVRGARLRRVRGAGPIGARVTAMALLAAAAWAPYAIAHTLGIHLYASYAGELLALLIAYPALLSAAARLADSRREPLLSALSRDE